MSEGARAGWAWGGGFSYNRRTGNTGDQRRSCLEQELRDGVLRFLLRIGKVEAIRVIVLVIVRIEAHQTIQRILQLQATDINAQDGEEKGQVPDKVHQQRHPSEQAELSDCRNRQTPNQGQHR